MAELGLAYEPFRQLNPRLVMCSITPFGLTGPHKDYHAYELTTAHGGGWAWLSPAGQSGPICRPSRRPPPGRSAGRPDCGHGLNGSLRQGAGDRAGEHIDLSVQEYVASFLEQNFVYYSYMGRSPRAWASGSSRRGHVCLPGRADFMVTSSRTSGCASSS